MRCRFICDGDVWTKARGVSNLPSTLHSNVSPIAGIAIDGFVAVLGARIRAAGGGDEKESRGSNLGLQPKPPLMRLNVFAQRKSISTLHCNISLIGEIATGFRGGLGGGA